MVNIETVKFIAMLNKLAVMTKDGFMDFHSTDDADEINNFDGILYDSQNGNQVVQDKCVINDGAHKDIVSYYGGIDEEDDNASYVTVQVAEVEGYEPDEEDYDERFYLEIHVTQPNGEEYQFEVWHGSWKLVIW